MKYFLGGFLVASIVWVGVMFAQSKGAVEVFAPYAPPVEVVDTIDTEIDTDSVEPQKKKRRGKKRHRARNLNRGGQIIESDLGYEQGDGQVGDDLTLDSRNVGMDNSGEGQLSSAEIDAAIDRRFNGIERCLTLVPPDAPTTGKLVLGLNIANSGSVTKVNLRGPNAMIKGDAGACFRRIVKAMEFRSFGGPDMVVHYPIEFE